jgi:uncharacterized membrane-anchored protein YhcB (DUF1043 family)
MEIISVNGLLLIISVCVIAFFIGRLTSKEREDKKRLEIELKESREELKNYRSEVTSHFQETAHKVNALTENYRNVYEHLARGAQSLCNKSDAPVLMNELNRNPMLGGETVENSKVDHEIVSAEASVDTGSAEPGIVDENPDHTTASNDQAKSNDGEADQSSDTVEGSEADKNISEATDSDEPIIAANEHIEHEQQTPR